MESGAEQACGTRVVTEDLGQVRVVVNKFVGVSQSVFELEREVPPEFGIQLRVLRDDAMEVL